MHPRSFLIIVLAIVAVLALAGCNGPTKAGQEARADARERLGKFNSRFTFDQAKQEFESGQLERAAETIDIAIQQDPESVDFFVLRGRIFLESRKLERALESFLAAAEMDETAAEPHYYAGIIYQRWSDDEPAHQHYARAFELEHDNVQYLLATAESLVSLGELERARELIESKLAYFENDATMRHLLAQIALIQDDPKAAAHHYEEARLLDPDNNALIEELAWTQFDAGLYGQCLDTIDLLRSRNAGEPIGLLHLEGRCYVKLDRTTDAHRCYAQLIRDNPSDPAVWIEFGILTWELGDYRRVAQCSVRVIALAPDRFEGYMLKGLYERHQGRFDEAIRLFEQSTDLAPNVVLPHLLLGRTLEQAGRDQDALSAYARATSLDPSSVEAQFLRRKLEERLHAAVIE